MSPENPYEVTTVRCAGCNTVKQTVNHWFVITVGGQEEDYFNCQPFSKAWVGAAHQRPVCGHACATKILGEYLDRRR